MEDSRKRQRESGSNLQESCPGKAHKIPAPLPGKNAASTPHEDLGSDTSSSWHYPPEFWDRLSTIPLTHSALEEFVRRQRVQPALPPPPQPQPPPVPTTRPIRDLARFARHGGPDLRGLRGYRAPKEAYHKPASAMKLPPQDLSQVADDVPMMTSVTTKSKKSAPQNRAFEQHLIDHGIHSMWESEEVDLDPVYARLSKPRPSLSSPRLSDGAFKNFCRSNARAKDEEDVMRYVIPIIAGPWEDNYPSVSSMTFGNLEPLTDGTIPAPKPDVALGSLPQQLHPTVRKELQHHIVPSTATDRLLAPNFFMEAKGPYGSTGVMARQARHDGAVGARAMHRLQNYGRNEAVWDEKAYTYSTTYCDGVLKIYAHHTTAPTMEGALPEYHMNIVHGYCMTSHREAFVEGATAYRNLRDLAKQHRDELIGEANARYHAAISKSPQNPAVTAEALSKNAPLPEESVVCEPPSTPQDNDEALQAGGWEASPVDSQRTVSAYAGTKSAVSSNTSSTSKRKRDPQRPPLDPRRQKKQAKERPIRQTTG